MTEESAPEEEIETSPEDSREEVANDTKPEEEEKRKSDVLLNKDIQILYQEPMAHLHKGKIRAYRAVGRNKVVSDLVAFVCHKSLTPRRIASIKYGKVANPNIAKLVTSDTVVWPDTGEEHFCFVYENTLGQPIWKSYEKHPALGWKPDMVLENIAHPIISILMDLRDKDLVHGEIWPGNMFFSSTVSSPQQTSEKIKLGECLAAPASSQLPALYEPIERALASPTGRGGGTFADDLYSFGVSLAVILRTTDTLQGLTDEEIIERKIEKGSYATLIGKDRLSGGLLELLRGLLYDDPLQRWTLDDVQAWMDGRRLSPKQAPKRVKATRPLLLNNKKYIRPELLAKDMWRYTDEVAKITENGELDQWIERAIEDKILKARMDQLFKEMKSIDRGKGYPERLAVILSTTLYTECPVRYKNLSFIPSGFGKILSEAYVQKHDLQPYIEILKQNFIIQSIRNRRKVVDSSSLISKLDTCRSLINQQSVGSGLERCLYVLDSECPCLSPVFDKYYVQTPEELILAFEKICENSKSQALFDRHVVAFLSVKDRKNIDPYMGEINSAEPHNRVLGQIRTLATIQKRASLGKLPAIAEWVAENLEDVYERFHDSKKRADLREQVEAIKKSGDISKIAALFDDPKLYQSDVHAFHQAMEEYQRIEYEKQLIEEKLKNRKDYGQKTGRQIASVISMFLSVFIIVVTAYVTLMKG
ncbi:MAG TPA: hypothetical protein PLF01_01290 [Alphaproteobacteria bacterium]|nr:hypothetical protein [Alphaproteobacteria bacterium]